MRARLCYLALILVVYSAPGKCAGVESLSPEIRSLLQAEMQALDRGFVEIFKAYYSGDFPQISVVATEMEASHILKKSLTPAQKEALHQTLPKEFLQRDKEFHYFAGMLSHVAEKKKPELVGFYISKLADACFACHADYASHKFKALAASAEPEAHHH